MKMKKRNKTNRRLTLKSWAAMDDFHRTIGERAKDGDWQPIPELVFKIIELVQPVDRDLFWMDVAQLYDEILSINSPSKKFPILNSREKSKKMPWEYEGRGWYFWLNLFASRYGWDSETIAKMDIDDAIALYQETLIDRQFEQEWEYGLSEIAYPYNPTTKKSRFSPMPRPDWMQRTAGGTGAVKKVRMPRAILPQGNIVVLDE